ncbi:DHH family phosphoesterase [Planococcus shenhongbingii]|uniref:Cyclic-di-AMP phosphodiesterase n=1 Tax=Planococcus shenhongbingii TaxID=3058398 RepID=A0ABT8NCA2_9BACL|nr:MULTISPECIES: DHH family phosphoesterase [unclassified Planococcus (in: firmicutes)]MDN7245504.1 DHH family phosphoesterase [Planococcus sp. N017]WKA58594.1 DHH family phosphoesterase [Planococcus sp. N016]
MSAFFRKRKLRIPLLVLLFLGLAAAILVSLRSEWAGGIFIILFGAVFIYAWITEKRVYEATEKHIETLSYRMKKVGEEALLEMPIGILLVNENFDIEWANPYMTSTLEYDTLIGESLYSLSDEFHTLVKSEEVRDMTITLGERKYRAYYKADDRLFYLFDITEQVEIETLYYADRTVIGILFIDNYDELSQGMDDQTRSNLNSLVTSLINEWGSHYGIFVKRISSDRFMAVFNESILKELELSKFAILDDIREVTSKDNLALTLSIGVGAGSASLVELGSMAQSGLDLVLGRGGDQVAIKHPSGKVKFYGGKTNPVEKRTRVRARVISHALRDLIQESDHVFVMGHKLPDMDAIGAAVGVSKMAAMNKVKSSIVLDFNAYDRSVMRLMEEIRQDDELFDRFITPEEALSMMTDNSLLVVVDTHKPSMVIDERVLQRMERVVLIDHHRRGEEFITNTMLVYMEPYASSTAELVTELIEYQPKHEKLSMLEATAMLAGIIVDTKSFTLRTGARTFEAASYLRSNGADTVLVQRLLKEDLETYLERAKIVQTVEFVADGIAIAKGEPGQIYSPVLIAQTADILLTMKDVNASFVVAERSEGGIGISARSLGEVNVQIVMENLGGGGHLTNAATQMPGTTIEEAIEQLKEAITEQYEGGKIE